MPYVPTSVSAFPLPLEGQELAVFFDSGVRYNIQTVYATLLSSDHYRMDEKESERVVVLRRTAVPFVSVEEITRASAQITSQLRAYHRRWGALVDLRQAPPRNDEAFEQATKALRAAMSAHFARVAVLIQTPVGALQVNRVQRDEGVSLFVTMSEQEALSFASGTLKG